MRWPEVPLSPAVADVVRGVTFSQGDAVREPRDGYLPVLRAGNIAEALVLDRDLVWIPKSVVTDQQVLRPHDIIMCTSSGSPAIVGKSGILEEIFEGTWGAFNAVIRVGENAVPRFVFYFLQSSLFRNWRDRHATGLNIQNIRFSELATLRIPLPVISEQRRIVQLLDEADRLRKLRREADMKAAQILPALFLKMFGDPATNPHQWSVLPLGQLADDRPEYGANSSAVPFEPGKPRYIRITDIREDGTLSGKEVVTLDATDWSRYLLSPGDVLFARSGNTVGKTYIYRPGDGECAFAGYLIRFRFTSGKINPHFVFGLTQTRYYRAWVEAHKRVAGQPNINAQEYASLRVPVPAESLQLEFARISKVVGEALVRANSCAGQIEQLFGSLMQRAFSGEITAKWREAHMKELLAEMEQQAKHLRLPLPIADRLAVKA